MNNCRACGVSELYEDLPLCKSCIQAEVDNSAYLQMVLSMNIDHHAAFRDYFEWIKPVESADRKP